MDGLIKFSTVPSERLYHPVLSFRCNNKLIFASVNVLPHLLLLK